MALTLAKIFPMLMESLELYGCVWLFAGVCVMGLIFTTFVFYETKGIILN